MKSVSNESENFLGKRLRQLRLKNEYTQQDIADALQVSRSTYSYYELGTTRPDPAVLGMLSNYYNVPVEIFFDESINLDIMLMDPNGRRRRTSRLGNPELNKVGDLRPNERSLLLFLRSHPELPPEKLLDELKERLGADLEDE